MRTVWTDTNNYVNRCEPAWKIMRTSVNWKHIVVSVTLKNLWTGVNQQKNIMWTGVNRRVKLCEPMRTVVRTNWKSGDELAQRVPSQFKLTVYYLIPPTIIPLMAIGAPMKGIPSPIANRVKKLWILFKYNFYHRYFFKFPKTSFFLKTIHSYSLSLSLSCPFLWFHTIW